MSELTVLGDTVIKSLLLNLSREEIGHFQKELEDSLIAYSGEQERQCQPSPGIINRPEGQKILFRPFTSPTAVGTKIIVTPAPVSEPSDAHSQQEAGSTSIKQTKQPPLRGVVVLTDSSGIPTGVLNAEEVTGYRTSFSAMLPYVSRLRTSNIIIFGAGKQALWHTRLALALRGSDIKTITIVNRSEPRAQELIKTVEEENKSRWKVPSKINFLNSSQPEAQEQLLSLLSTADVIFCTVGSKEPLFSLESLALDKRQGKYPLITAVGSWQADMIEVDPAILQHVANASTGGETGVVLVDDGENAVHHAGEIVRSGLEKTQLLEIGEVIRRKRDQSLTNDMATWLAEGLVVYKSIGVSVTDLAAGNAILALAAKNKVGTSISGF